MAKENVIELKSIKAHIMFTINNEHSESEVSLEVNNAEDIETIMHLYFTEKWDDLFGDDYDRMEFEGASFMGISFTNTDDNHINMQIYSSYVRGSCLLDTATLADKNAEKLKKIREIANG